MNNINVLLKGIQKETNYLNNKAAIEEFLIWLDNNNFSMGGTYSYYKYYESKSYEFRANIYFGKIAVFKLIIFMNPDNQKENQFIIQSIRNWEKGTITISKISLHLQNDWKEAFKQCIYKVDTELYKLEENIKFLSNKIIEKIPNYMILPSIMDISVFLKKIVTDGGAMVNDFVNEEKLFDKNKIDKIIFYMKEKGIYKIDGGTNWYLTINGDYYNKYASKINRLGNFYDLKAANADIGNLFKNQDKYINPFNQNSNVFYPSSIKHVIEEDNNCFRLINFKTTNKFLNNILIDLDVKRDVPSNDECFTTVIIGPNGSGKTYVLTSIEKIFQDLMSIKINGCRFYNEDYEITYAIGNNLYYADISEKEYIFKINEIKVSIKEVQLPKKLLVCSYMLNDRFTYNPNDQFENNNDNFYEYLGIRDVSNGSHLNTVSKKLLKNIIESRHNKDFMKGLSDVLSFLGLEHSIRLKFKSNPKAFDKNGVKDRNYDSNEYKDGVFDRIRKRIKKKEENYITNIDTIEQDIKMYSDFATKIINNLTNGKVSEEENYYEISYELNTDEGFNSTYDSEVDVIYEMLKLNIISAGGIEIKKNTYYSIESASSGENHFLFTMINVLSNVKENSIILIDEPEISLHPNWQYNYISLLKKISLYSTCHFVIATHSHFIVSDLDRNTSSIISMKKDDNGEIQITLEEENTLGRSAEDILYNVFKMYTTRNYYVANDVQKILKLMSEPITKDNTDRINQSVKKLKQINLDLQKEDPLYLIIKKILEEEVCNE